MELQLRSIVGSLILLILYPKSWWIQGLLRVENFPPNVTSGKLEKIATIPVERLVGTEALSKNAIISIRRLIFSALATLTYANVINLNAASKSLPASRMTLSLRARSIDSGSKQWMSLLQTLLLITKLAALGIELLI